MIGDASPPTGDEPVAPKPPRTWRPMVFWTAGILAALGLAWFVGAVVVPVWQMCRAVESSQREGFTSSSSELADRTVSGLGGRRRAADRLALYLRLPDRLAPCKAYALVLFNACEPEGRPPVDALAGLLADPDPETRRQAAHWLGRIGAEAGPAVPALVAALDDDRKIDPIKLDTGPWYGSLDYCRDDPWQVRWYATVALGRIGPEARAAVPRLIELLDSEDAEMRLATIGALGSIGPDAAAAVPRLLEIRRGNADGQVRSVSQVQKAAAAALAKIRGAKEEAKAERPKP